MTLHMGVRTGGVPDKDAGPEGSAFCGTCGDMGRSIVPPPDCGFVVSLRVDDVGYVVRDSELYPGAASSSNACAIGTFTECGEASSC